MCELIGGPGACFDALSVPDKMRIVELVNQCDMIEAVAELKVGFDNIDHELTAIGDWFRNSKVYYP